MCIHSSTCNVSTYACGLLRCCTCVHHLYTVYRNVPQTLSKPRANNRAIVKAVEDQCMDSLKMCVILHVSVGSKDVSILSRA